MKEIVVISGKGGTGKTSVTGSLALLSGNQAIIADCDVDAADMHLLLKPDYRHKEDFYSGKVARINQDICKGCGKCARICRFDAVSQNEGKWTVDELSCEGCAYCSEICPAEAIENIPCLAGELYISTIRTGGEMVHARLGIGSDNSGKLVAQVKKEARRLAEEQDKKWILIDGSPGVGCPVVSSLSGASMVLLVTEPSVSGIHDLKRVHQLVKKFKLPSVCLINKSDINLEKRNELCRFLEEEGIPLLAEIPYNRVFLDALNQGLTVVERDQEIKSSLKKVWKEISRV